MILRFQLQGQDTVVIDAATPENTDDVFRPLTQVEFAKDASYLVLETLEAALKENNIPHPEIKCIVVQWGPLGNEVASIDKSRFTVARLTGTTANTLAWSLKIPIIAVDSEVADAEIVKQVAAATIETNPRIEIQYSGEPTISL